MRNRLISFLSFSLLFLLFTSCNFDSGQNSQAGDEEDRFIVGANLTLTGSAAHWGTEMRDGLTLGFKESSNLLAKGSVDVRFEDNMMNPREAVSIAKKFTDIDKVDLMISAFSPFVKSTMNIAEQKEVLMLATLTSAVDIAKGKDWIFRDFVPETVYMPLLADYAFIMSVLIPMCMINSIDS
ncbi:MAG: ABC transporter substrate-binding protein [Bacteroidota bacterium]|nr:ABC transporter substrate-binding protein [Bacteroidota bacterium]